MPYKLYESLVAQLSAPRAFLLNYSGESTVYPELISAIRLARSTRASVELVSALVNVPEAALAELCDSGLSRLTVSVHSTDPMRYPAIYRYGTFEALRTRLTSLVKLRQSLGSPAVVDLAFVAMESNLSDLPGVAALAQSLELRDIYVFPVIRRDEIPSHFRAELSGPGMYRTEFADRLKATVAQAEGEWRSVSLTICNPSFNGANAELGEAPMPYPGALPPGALIHSCDQNPWETAHVLSNGDVVACEVLDRTPLGNVARQTLSEVWHGEAYRQFRERYRRGDVAECRSCPWKRAYRPCPMRSEIIAARGRSAQLLHGWHEQCGEPHIWASQQALAVLEPREGSRTFHVSGMLPAGQAGDVNELVIACNQAEIGRVTNPWEETIPFGLDFSVPHGLAGPWYIEFRTRHVFRPIERGLGQDQRDLGFALVLLASKECVDPEIVARGRKALRALPYAIRAVDVLGRSAAKLFRWGRAISSGPSAPGLSVLIPERDNVAELSECLAGVERAAARWMEPIEVIVVVNGSPVADYRALRERYPDARWEFSQGPLGFSGAVARGLRKARFQWVYLLNSDVVLGPEALAEAGRHRNAGIFSIASQILLKDRTRFREETNWTTLFLDGGLVTTHDRIPESDQTVAGFYAGGGASLFQKRLLKRFARVSAYHPFYWEDVEWGWRARKRGYGSLFCPTSVAHHTQRSTIDRHYRPAEVERVLRRNRLLFQLRNLTGAGSLWHVREEAAISGCARFLYGHLWSIACGRLWNHLAPVPDEEVLAQGEPVASSQPRRAEGCPTPLVRKPA